MRKTVVIALLQVVATCVYAQTITPNLSFASGGTLMMHNRNVGDARSVAIQSDGKIITAGGGSDCNSSPCNSKFTLTRHNADGTLDVSFGRGGVAFISPSENGMIDYSADAANLAVAPDGKILVTGEYSEYDYDLKDYGNFYTTAIRLNEDGTLDQSFGGNGIVNIKLSSAHERAQGIAVQADLKVVIVGMAFNSTIGTSSMTISRLNTDGSLDYSFNNSGKKFVNFSNYSEGANVKIQVDGKILACGVAYTDAGLANFAVTRLNEDGTYDNGFNREGKALIDLGGRNNFASDLDIQTDGKIVIGGYVEVRNSYDFGIARLNASGTPDRSFGREGKKIIDFNAADDLCFSIAVENDGKILAGGYSNYFAGQFVYGFNITKLNADGNPDILFEKDGTKFIDFGSQAASYDFALQNEGKIIAAGFASDGPSHERALASISTTSNNQPASAISMPGQGNRPLGLELKTFPNPGVNVLLVSVASDKADQKISMRVMDLQGRVLQAKNNMYSGQTFKVGEKLLPGIYYVEATQGQTKKVLKVTKVSE